MIISKNIILAGIIVATIPFLTLAATPAHEGYLVDSEVTIVKSGTGLCWHTSSWTPAMAVAGCDDVPEMKITHPIIIRSMSMPEHKPAPVHMKINLFEEDLFNFNRLSLSTGLSAFRELAEPDLRNKLKELGDVQERIFTDNKGSLDWHFIITELPVSPA